MRNFIRARRRFATAGVAFSLAALGGVQACRATDLLETQDPDVIFPEDLDSPQGAEGLRLGALSRLRTLAGGSGSAGENAWLYSGLLVDEFGSSSTFTQNDETDKRAVLVNNALVTSHFRDYHRARVAPLAALEALRRHNATDVVSAAEMFFVKGFAELSLAQDFCNGVPLSRGLSSEELTYGGPLNVVQVFDTARASFDSALALLPASVTGTQATLIRNAARVGKARALVGISRSNLAEAAALVGGATPVPTNFAYNSTFVVGTGDNQIWAFTTSNRRYTIGDSVEGNARNIRVLNAIPFVSARDPRVPADYVRQNIVRDAAGNITRADTVRGQDGQTYARVQTRYGRSDPLAIVNSIDARLIQAEAQMEAGNFATPATGTLAILNALRQGPTRVGGSDNSPLNVSNMAALTDPGTPEAREDLFFREKAFWTFGRGQRLNDLRRLVRQYQRAPTATFPFGPYYKGGDYGPDMNFPVPQAELNNPQAQTCTNRDA
ncbi:MAG: hypothetical protein ABR499_02200 [Gemmatimonadaceae bacterium]